MPRIPIIPPRDSGAGGTGGGPHESPGALPPEQADALRVLEDRTARIDRELAVAQSWRAAVDRLAEAEEAEDGPPPGFTRRFLEESDKERAALLKTVPTDRQDALEHDLLSLRSVFADRAAQVEASGLALRRRAGLYRALDEYRQGVTGDPGLYDEAVQKLDGLSTDLGLPEDRLEAMRDEVRDMLGNAAVDGLMADPDRVARMLSDGLFDDALSEASKARRLSEAQTEAARRKLLSREQAVSNLTAQARQGTAPDETLLAAEKDGTLAPAEAAALRRANAQAAERAAQRDARIRRVATMAEPLDPADPEDRAAASDYWESIAEVYRSDDPEEQRANELALVERIGVLPDGLARKFQGALLSDDPVLALSGARAIAALNELNPALVANFRPDRLRRAQAMAEFAGFDLPPERIVELAEARINADEARPAARDVDGVNVEPVEEQSPETGSTTFLLEPGSDQTDGPFDGIGDEGVGEAADDASRRSNGSAFIVDPETGETATVDRDAVDRFDALVQQHETLLGLRQQYLELYDRVAAGALSREEATRLLLDGIDAALPGTNESGSPLADNIRLRQTLQRLATDIFDAGDRTEADKIFTGTVVPSDNVEAIGELILSILPVTGELISARDAYAGFTAAIAAAREGEAGEALLEGGLATVATLGAIPLIGYLPRLGRGALKAFRASKQLLKHRRSRQRARDAEVEESQDWIDDTETADKTVGHLDPLDPDSFGFPYDSGKLVLDQGNENSCGIYCGAMALDTLGNRYDIDEIKKLAKFTEEDGTEIGNLASALRRLGVENARLKDFFYMEDLAKHLDERHPAIAVVRLIPNKPTDTGLHGVVVDRIKFRPETEWKGAVFIRDPAGGREYISPLLEFEKKYVGTAIVIEVEKQ